MQSGRRIAFDFGETRIGVAVSDLSGLLATPYSVINATSDRYMIEVLEMCRELEPLYIVVGDPRHLSGKGSESGRLALAFAQGLSEQLPTPIFIVDERLTTVQAASRLREAGKNAKNTRKSIDAAAACLILEVALDSERLNGQPSSHMVLP